MVPNPVFLETNSFLESAQQRWLEMAGPEVSMPVNTSSQKEWDLRLCKTRYDSLLASATTDRERARLLTVAARNSSDWLQAFPISSLGLKLDDKCLQISCTVRLGATICRPHTCFKCCKEVDSQGTHGLSCSFSVGRHPRHNRINHIIKRALGNADLNARTEPYTANLCSAEGAIGLVPVGVTLQTFKHGKPLIWDFTCHDMLAPSYLRMLPIVERSVAKKAEDDKDWNLLFIEVDFIAIEINSNVKEFYDH